MRQVAEGDESAFTKLFHAYRNLLYAFILPLTRSSNAAEDIVQNTFLKIWTSRANLYEVKNFKAYLFQSAKYAAIDALRRLSRENLALFDLYKEEHGFAKDPEKELVFKQYQALLRKAIDDLPPQQRTVYLLSRDQGLKGEEIASHLDISLSTVKNHMTRALKTIKEKLGLELLFWSLAVLLNY